MDGEDGGVQSGSLPSLATLHTYWPWSNGCSLLHDPLRGHSMCLRRLEGGARQCKGPGATNTARGQVAIEVRTEEGLGEDQGIWRCQGRKSQRESWFVMGKTDSARQRKMETSRKTETPLQGVARLCQPGE